MADLINVDDLIEAIGREPEDTAEATKWEHYITKVSTYINSQCSVSFTPFSATEEKHQADYRGIVTDLTLPITAVTEIANVVTGDADPDGAWDYNEQIYNLSPNQVVLVTYTGGMAKVPDDIRMVAIDSCVALIDGPDNDALVSYQIGDVVEKYKSPTVSDVVEELGEYVLNQYRPSEGTWHLGSGYYPDATDTRLPTL